MQPRFITRLAFPRRLATPSPTLPVVAVLEATKHDCLLVLCDPEEVAALLERRDGHGAVDLETRLAGGTEDLEVHVVGGDGCHGESDEVDVRSGEAEREQRAQTQMVQG